MPTREPPGVLMPARPYPRCPPSPGAYRLLLSRGKQDKGRDRVRAMGALTARLEVVAGNAAGMTILVEDELLIGRLGEGAGRLAGDEEMSRSHARVTVDADGTCAIEDLGST